MGLAVGSLVWVQRKNGSWWPGKVLGLDEISCPLKFSSPSEVKAPIKLLGRLNGSVEWYNSEMSKRIKPFRSAEFDGFIKNAESVQASFTIKDAKYARQDDAVLHALQLEKQEQEKSHITRGNVQQGALCRAKRSRCVYLPVESNHSPEHSVLHSQSLKIFPSACATEEHKLVSSLAAKKASSKSQVSDCSECSFEDSDGDGVKQHTGSYGNGRQKRRMNLQKKDRLSYSSESSLESKIASGVRSQNWNLNEQPRMQNSSGIPNTVTHGTSSAMSRKRTRNIEDVLVLYTPYKEEKGYRSDTKSTEHLGLEVESLFHTISGGNYLEDFDSLCYGSAYDDHQNMMETLLMNVDITIQSNFRKEQVPLVSLMSKLNKKAIIGYPIEVEVLEDDPQVFLVRKDSVDYMVDNSDTKAHQLVWRTSKRTPVRYITNYCSPPTDKKDKKASKTYVNSKLEAKANNIPLAKESLLNSPKMGNVSGQNGHTLQIHSQSSRKVRVDKQGGSLVQGASCVPVNIIFTKLFSAVGT